MSGVGVIEGSEETLDGSQHYLTSPAYYNLSTRNQSTFADNRDTLYKLFTQYLGKKKWFRDLDSADRFVY
jgi:hypothetical protein